MNAGKCYDTLSIGKEEQPAALQGHCLALQRQSGAWLSNDKAMMRITEQR